MADYSSSEIQAAVEKVVRSSIRRPYGTLGNRDVQTTFNDLQDAASGVYILKPNAPFYTVFLGAQRLLGLLANEYQTLSSLVEAIENTNRRVTEIDNLAPLNNARAALDALSNAAGARSKLFTSIEDVPAFQRYDQNVQRFLDESSKNSRARGQIVPTPQESRASLAGLVRSLQAQHEEILFRSLKLAEAIDDYDALNLPSLVASSVIANARAVLESRITELEALTPKERLSRIRDVTLDLLAGRAAVQGLGSLRATTTFALIEGAGAPFADTDHPASSASLSAKLGPYPVWAAANTLNFTLDGSFSFSAILPGSYLAQIDSGIPEPYLVSAGDNDHLVIDTEVLPALPVRTELDLTAGTRTAAQIATEINAALPLSSPIVAESVIQVFRFIGVADLDVTGSPSDADFVLPAPGDWSFLGARQNDIVRITDPLSPNFGCEFTVDAGGVNGDTLTCSQTAGPVPVDETLAAIEVGVGKTLRLRIKTGSELASLNGRTAIIFPNIESNNALYGNPFALTPVPMALGFPIGGQARSRSTTAAQIAQDVPRLAATQTGGVARLDASVEFVASVWDGPGRSDPDNPNKLIALRLWARGDAPAGQLGLVFQVPGAVDADVEVGDILVIRETPVSADQNVMGTVLSFTDETITVDMAQPITGGVDLQIEVGPNLSISSEYLEARVTLSLFQDGDYFMDASGAGDIPFEFIMEGQVPQHRGIGGQPQFFDLALGYNRVNFLSTKTDLTTKVQVTGGTAYSQIFTPAAPIEAAGTTPYFQLPEDPRSLQVGDTLEIYETTYNIISDQFQLMGLELSNLLIELEPEISTDFGTVQLSQVSEPPFARIRLSKKNNYTIFEERLEAWLELGVNQPSWFVDLNRLLNPLIANENPTAAQVNTAKLHVQSLLAVLTRAGAITTNSDPDETLESILMGYTVEPVEEVDVLVATYLERGATRGIDLLLQGRFNEFFGLTTETMSYDGAAREALKEVQRLDLPIRKSGRTQNLDIAQTIAEWEDPDFEFDQSDTENAEDIEIPGDFTEITPPGR